MRGSSQSYQGCDKTQVWEKRVNLRLLVIALAIQPVQCKTSKDKGNPDDLYRTSYTGYNLSAHAEVCVRQAESDDCDERPQEQQDFSQKCEDAGHESLVCSCSKILCSFNIANTSHQSGSGNSADPDKIYHGYDLNGDKRSCKLMPKGTICTAVVTDADRFGKECEARGYKSYTCGCHDIICSVKFTPTHNSN